MRKSFQLIARRVQKLLEREESTSLQLKASLSSVGEAVIEKAAIWRKNLRRVSFHTHPSVHDLRQMPLKLRAVVVQVSHFMLPVVIYPLRSRTLRGGSSLP